MPLAPGDGITADELQLAARNHGMPLEALRHTVTPVGLHYLLIHYDIPVVDPQAWRLHVGRRELTLDEIRALPRVTAPVTMECAGNGRAALAPRPISQPWLLEAVGNAEWTGTPLRPLLEGATGVEVLFTGLDRGVENGIPQAYERALPLEDALKDDVLLAYELNGAPLPPQHGFPLRLLVPGWYGMTSVKWLSRIEVLDEPYTGYQNATAYRVRESEDDPGTPVTRIEPRALMAPPGVPDFMTRRRFVEPGPTTLEGRAWSGHGPIERVEVSTDAGASWHEARLGDAHGWRAWSYAWEAPPGDHVLACRAFDATGRGQPDEPPWNLGGYANNAVHRIAVTVG
ncbi:MAG: sulfite oxidase [Actinomycetota bacterium]|nr:sulfite oxidase [Actinomycetota bacterium]MDQ5807354.1 sulfite oxidase [Actinomycetota bacterium]